MIEISHAAKSDIPLIQQIAHQTWPATFSTIISKGKMNYMLEMMYSIQSLTEQIEKNGHCFILAKNNQQGVGFALSALVGVPRPALVGVPHQQGIPRQGIRTYQGELIRLLLINSWN